MSKAGGGSLSPSFRSMSLAFERCRFEIFVPSLPSDKKENLVQVLNGIDFSGIDTLMSQLFSNFFADLTSEWFIEIIEYLMNSSSNLAYCSVNKLPITFNFLWGNKIFCLFTLKILTRLIPHDFSIFFLQAWDFTFIHFQRNFMTHFQCQDKITFICIKKLKPIKIL